MKTCEPMDVRNLYIDTYNEMQQRQTLIMNIIIAT